jgi:hypothetical protein
MPIRVHEPEGLPIHPTRDPLIGYERAPPGVRLAAGGGQGECESGDGQLRFSGWTKGYS